MSVTVSGNRPGLRRVLDAVSMTTGIDGSAPVRQQPAGDDWRAAFARNQQRVADHYRRLLETQQMDALERQTILARIAALEQEVTR